MRLLLNRCAIASAKFVLYIDQAEVASVVVPGGLIGVESGTPLKPGLYLLDTTAYGGQSGSTRIRSGFNIWILLGALAWTMMSGRIESFVSQPYLFADGTGAGPDRAELFNTLVGTGLAWKLDV